MQYRWSLFGIFKCYLLNINIGILIMGFVKEYTHDLCDFLRIPRVWTKLKFDSKYYRSSE